MFINYTKASYQKCLGLAANTVVVGRRLMFWFCWYLPRANSAQQAGVCEFDW
jgi:hypothetical protein